jgi:hypothetical protein
MPISTIGGKTFTNITAIPTKPTLDFNNPKLDRTVSQASEIALPTIGTPLDTTNFKALAVTLSLELHTLLCIVTIPENMNIDTLMLQTINRFTNLTIPPKYTSGHMLPIQEIAKLILVSGNITLSANCTHN